MTADINHMYFDAVSTDYTERPEYREYAARVSAAVTKRMKLSEIRRALGDGFIEHWNLIDTLDRVATPVIDSWRMEWVPAVEVEAMPKVDWNGKPQNLG